MKKNLILLVFYTICFGAHSQNSSTCIGNLGTPNPWPASSPSAGGYIPLGNFGAQNTFSIAMWINPANVQSGIGIIIDASHGGSSNWVIQTLNSGGTWTWGSGEFTLTPNEWQHLLLTYHNGNRKIFINGTEVQSWFQVINYSGSPSLYLGNWPEGGRRFNGKIDELYITTGILENNNFTPMNTVNSPAPNTFGLWHFDEGTGSSTTNTNGVTYSLNNWYWDSRLLNITSENESSSASDYVPAAIAYQAVARDAQGQSLSNANVQIRFTLLADSLTGASEYVETHTLTTNEFGLFTTAFGSGTPVTSTFAAINWARGNKYLKVELDAGQGYVDMGTQQLLSVPFALRSKSAGEIENDSLPVFPDNAAALAGGLTAGKTYRTATGDLKVVY